MTTFTTGRERLSFSVDQLHPREELLFKSLVRVLDHRTQHRWSCVEREGDLRVTGAAADPGTADGPVLHIGESGPHALALPLHAQQLEAMLNRLGGMITSARIEARAPAPSASPPAAAPHESTAFHLHHWPPAALLRSAQHITLATLLSARPHTLSMLQRRSGASVELCSAFLDELRQADVLLETLQSPADAPAPCAVAAAAQSGLFARIRARLGLRPTPVR